MADSTYLNLRSSAATDPIRNFRFLVRFTPIGSESFKEQLNVGFMTVQGLNVTTTPIPYREGAYNTTVHQLPGQQQFSPVTLQRGVVLGSNFGWNWFTKTYDPGTGTESVTGDFRYTVNIKVLRYPTSKNRNMQQDDAADSLVAAEFTLMNAWPTTLAYSDLNAADSAILVEQLVLVHEGFLPSVRETKTREIGANGKIT